MGMPLMSSPSYDSPASGNPDPRRYSIISSEQINNFLILEIKYDGCTNYDGRKILVYHNVSISQLLDQGMIDPHFAEDKRYISPVARFVPDEIGRKLARLLCSFWNTTCVTF